jgi:lia operon protein LiaF
MRYRGQLIIGSAVILVGVLMLIGAVFDVDMGILCFPTVLILLGIWILVRPQMVRPGTGVAVRLLGDVRRSGSWQVTQEEFWVGIGDVRLDLTEAEVPVGKTTLRLYGFVNDVRLVVPEEVAVAVASSAFLCDARVMGRKTDTFLGTFFWQSEGYEAAERKVQLEALHFVHSLRITEA